MMKTHDGREFLSNSKTTNIDDECPLDGKEIFEDTKLHTEDAVLRDNSPHDTTNVVVKINAPAVNQIMESSIGIEEDWKLSLQFY